MSHKQQNKFLKAIVSVPFDIVESASEDSLLDSDATTSAPLAASGTNQARPLTKTTGGDL